MSESVQNSLNPREILQRTLDCIPDENLRRYIFGTPKPKMTSLINNLISAMNNIMLMSFFGMYGVWREFRDVPERREDSVGRLCRSASNANRVDETMSHVYCDNILTQEVISFVFTELLLEIDGNSYTPFNNLIRGKISAAKFPKIAEIIRVWKINFKGAEQNYNVLGELYVELLDALSILKYMAIEEREGTVYCKVNVPSEREIEFDLSIFVRSIEVDGVAENYYLYRAKNAKGKVYLQYMSFNGISMFFDDESKDFVVSKETFYNLTCNRIERTPSNDIAKSLKINDFKYIHRLALCVSDSLGQNTKRELLERIREKEIYRENFRNKSIDDVNWDNTVVLLMLEEGPSEILESVLKNNNDAFDEILTNVSIRFSLNYRETVREYRRLEQDEQIYQDMMQIDYARSNKVKSWMKNAKISLMSQFIISKVAQTEVNKERDNKAFYAESIMMKLQKIDSIVERCGALNSIIYINKMLERVLRTLIPFYEGILAYAKCREKMMEKYPLNERHKEGILREVQTECERAFFERAEIVLNGAKEIAEDGEAAVSKIAGANRQKPVKQATLGELLQIFRELCKRMDATNGKSAKFSEEHLLLHSVIGRRQICDISTFDSIIECDKDDFVGISDYPKSMPAFFNCFKHDKPSAELVAQDPRVIKNYIGYIRDLFEFFNINGDFKHRRKTNAVNNIGDPIFPYVVRYSEKNENRDRCSVCQYIISADGGFEDKKIKLLTEYEYDMNELYYCIPNEESSTQNWWVSPFLISCRRFDQLLLGKTEAKD